MKYTVSKVFDLSEILASKVGQTLKAYLEYMSQLNEQVLRLGTNNITIDDNLASERKTITYTPGQVQYELVGTKGGKPAHVMLGESDLPITNPFTFAYRFDGRSNKTSVYLKPLTEPKTKCSVEVIILYR